MADDRGMIFDHGAAEPDDLIAKLLSRGRQIGGGIGA